MRQEIDVSTVLARLGGSFAVIGESDINGVRTVDMEGCNGRHVQVVTTGGSVVAYLYG